MDPVSALGVASGVIAVLQMTGTLISQSYGYIAALKDAPKDLSALVQELSSLSGILSALKVQLETNSNPQRSSALELLGKPEGPLDSCKKILARVEKRLKKLDDRRLGSYIVGPLKDKIIRQDIEQLERLKSVFQLALYTDQMTLSKAIDEYLRKTLEDYKKEQEVLGKHIRDTDDNVAELCRESKRRELEGKLAQENVQKVLENSVQNQERIGKHARDTYENIIDLRSETDRQKAEEKKKLEEERRDKIARWLSTIDYQSNHHTAHSLQQPGTGAWFVEGQDFKKWQDIAGSALWLHGIPGAGKTILTSTIIEKILAFPNVLNNGAVAVYFYFDFKDHAKQATIGMLGSLISQLLRKLDVAPGEADALFEKYHGDIHPSLNELVELLKTILSYFTKCFVVIDALDECNERPILLSTLDKLIGSEELRNTNFLFTSRKEDDIKTCFSKHSISHVLIQTDKVDADVSLYVTQGIEKDEQLRKFPIGLKEDIRIALATGSRGMFRWAKCQLDIIRELKRPKDVRNALSSLPITLDDTYDRILLGIKGDSQKELIRRALQFVVYAARPMTLEEVAEAVVVEIGVESLEQDARFFEPSDLISICGSLFSLIGEEYSWFHRPIKKYLGLAHYSVQEYLKSQRILNGPASGFAMDETRASIEISKICLTYLGFNDFETGICLSENDYNIRLKSFPLLEYAAKCWFEHVRSGAIEKNIIELATRIWSATETPKYFSWRQVYDSYREDRLTYGSMSTLYHPACWNLPQLTHHLLEMGAICDSIDLIYKETALYAASVKGHEITVKVLLQHGADVNIQGAEYGTALYVASSEGHEKVVETLLQHGADVNIQGGYYGTALQVASSRGYEKVVEILLQHGADVNIQGAEYGTALYVASSGGYEKVVEILLQHGADVNIQGGYYETALQVASSRGHEKVVEILLQHGAGVCQNPG